MTTLLLLLCQSTVLLALGFLALRLTQKRGPAVQTLVGRATLSGTAFLLLLLPLSGRVAPVWRLPVSPPAPILGSQKDAEPLLAASSATPPPSALPAPSALPSVSPADAPEPTRPEDAETTKSADSNKGAASSAPTLSPAAVPHPSLRKDPASEARESKAAGLPTLLLLLWLALCRYHLIRLRRTARLVTDGPAAVLLAELAPNPPLLLTHRSVCSPFLAGTRRPAIFLPPTFAADFTPDALRAVFVHELAHRDRRDNLWTLASRLLTAVLWFQPLLWLLGCRLEQISEDACDQAVLAAHCPPRAYAACLLSLAGRPSLARRERTLTAGVAPFRSSVGRRISRILTLGVPLMPAVTLRLRLSVAALTLAAALGGAFLISSAPAQIQPQPTPFVPTPQELRHEAERKQDLQNLKSIGSAIIQYTQDHNERMPDAAHWVDQIASYRRDPSVFYDPFQPGQKRYAYAFNRNCSGKSLWKFAAPASTVAIFDSTLGTRNASDTGRSLRITSPASSRLHVVGSSYGFVDGHAKWFRPDVHPSFALDGGQPTALSESQMKVKADNLIKHYPGNLRIYGPSKNGTPVLLGATEPNQQLNQAQFLAGLTPVQGPGVTVTLRDSKKPIPAPMPAGMAPPNVIHDSDINQVVNELRAAGAEAVAVNGQRMVATSAVRCTGPTVYINNTPQEPPFIIKAIGDPKTLVGALDMPGGIASQIAVYDKAMFTVQQAQTLTLPAYTGGNEPRYAKPVSAADPVQVKLDFLREVEAAHKQHLLAYEKQVILTLDSKGTCFLDGVRLPEAQIEPFLAARARQNPNITAVIKCNTNQFYSRVGQLVNMVKKAGIYSIQLVSSTSGGTEPANTSGTTPATGTHTIIGYGLVSFMLSKHLYCHAVERSEAARLGISIETNSEIIGVNAGPVPKTAEQFIAICRATPPLRLLLKPVERKNFTHKTQSVTFQTKAPFTVVTDAARAEELGKGFKSAQADAAAATAALAHANAQLTEGVHALLPQAAPATLAKALNLERQIGWSMHRMSFAAQYVAWSRKKHNPKSKAIAANLEANVQTYLKPETDEEAQIFPQTADSRRRLAQLHVLAEHMGGMQIMVMEKRIQATALASVMQQRSPDTAI